MPHASVYQSTIHTVGAIFALCLLCLVSVGSATAGNALQCIGPTKNSVIACCHSETAAKRPLWMTDSKLLCETL